MFTQLKKRNEGFTIVELLIVIVVIGILAALVLNTFQGVQARARDTERKTDINAMHTQVEVFFNDSSTGQYPLTAAGLTTANLPGIDSEAFLDPDGVSVTAGTGEYAYDVSGATCDLVGCDSYTLTATMEEESDYVKNSLN